MSPPVQITIPAAVAAYVRKETPLQQRLHAAQGEVELHSWELLLLLFCLSKDAEQEVRSAAEATLRELPDSRFDCLADWADPHPAILHGIAVACGFRPYVREQLLAHPATAAETDAFLYRVAEDELQALQQDVAAEVPGTECVDDDPSGLLPLSDDEDVVVDEDSEEFLSKFQLVQVMGIGEKIKMALTGDKEWRKILIKDANKLVSSGVLKNPRITEPEVLTILKSGIQNDEIMRLICSNKEWVKNYQIRKALIENPKTPLANALRFLGTMNEKDLSGYAKSRNISSVLVTQAKRMLLNKKRA